MLHALIENRYAVTASLLFAVGFLHVLLHPDLIRKVVAFNIMDSSVFLLLASRGMIAGRTAAILTDSGADPSRYVNPIPAGLVLTGIVVSVSGAALAPVLLQRLYGLYGTTDLRRLLEEMKRKGD